MRSIEPSFTDLTTSSSDKCLFGDSIRAFRLAMLYSCLALSAGGRPVRCKRRLTAASSRLRFQNLKENESTDTFLIFARR